MAHLLVSCVGFVNDTRTRDIIAIVQRFSDQPHHDGLPEHRQPEMILSYTLTEQRERTAKHAYHTAAMLVMWIFVFRIHSFGEDTLADNLCLTTQIGTHAAFANGSNSVLRCGAFYGLFVSIKEDISTNQQTQL